MSEILRSWKEIAGYAGASVRTLQRWEREFHLPIRRIATKKGSVVFAFRSDLDTWFRARTQTAEMAVRDEHFRTMFMNSPLPSMVIDNSRRILDLNEASCELLGVERTQLIGSVANILSDDTSEYDEEEWNHFLSAGASLGQRNLRRGDGTLVGVEYVMKNVFPGLNVITALATHPGGVPRSQVYYRLGRGSLSL
jgi:PAS domain S-box-containing protein